jgi:beta-galactosidase/beta-glucuronidase
MISSVKDRNESREAAAGSKQAVLEIECFRLRNCDYAAVGMLRKWNGFNSHHNNNYVNGWTKAWMAFGESNASAGRCGAKQYIQHGREYSRAGNARARLAA